MGSALEAGGLRLESKADVLALVGRPSQIEVAAADNWVDIVAGQPEKSYLMVLVGKYPGPIDPNIGTMPYASPTMCVEKQDALDRWIRAGAPAQ